MNWDGVNPVQISRSVSTVLYQSHFGHGIVECSPTLTSIQDYSNPTHDKQQWLLLQFIVLLMDAKSVRNMYSILVVVNKHNTARVASCWFIIYYILSRHLPYKTSVRKIHKYVEQGIQNLQQDSNIVKHVIKLLNHSIEYSRTLLHMVEAHTVKAHLERQSRPFCGNKNLVRVTTGCGISHKNTEHMIHKYYNYFTYNIQMLHQIHHTHVIIRL